MKILSQNFPMLIHVCALFLGSCAYVLSAPPPDPGDAEQLKAFLDPLIAEQLERLHIPGVAVSVVKGDSMVYSAGYGFADIERGVKVDPVHTIFRIGSVSKVVTATAVMQLVERGVLELDTDVNTYLKRFKLERSFPAPVTLRHLLTHTSGIDDRHVGIAVTDPARVMALGDYLEQKLPPRVRPSGRINSYSSQGVALAGYLMEVQSGMPFSRVVEENLLDVLEMDDSGFDPAQSTSSKWAAGYVYEDGTFTSVPLDYFHHAPAVGFHTSAEDMAHFMIAHLHDGVYSDGRVLAAETVQEMHRLQFTHHPEMPGFAIGFYERFRNGQRVLMHGGNIRGYAAVVMMIPEDGIGVFAVWNRDQAYLREVLFTEFLDHFYPAPEGPPMRPRVVGEGLGTSLSGRYVNTWYIQHDGEKLSWLLDQLHVTQSPDGTPFVRGYPQGEGEWARVGKTLFQHSETGAFMSFAHDDQRRVTHLFLNEDAYKKMRWYETQPFHITVIGGLLLLFAGSSFFWLRRLIGPARDLTGDGRWARITAVATAGFVVLFLVYLIVLVRTIRPWDYVYGITTPTAIWLCTPFVIAVLLFCVSVFMVITWVRRSWSIGERLHYTVMTIATAGFLFYVNYWNLFGIGYY